MKRQTAPMRFIHAIDGGGGIVVGVVDGGGGGSGVDGVEDVERALDEGRGGVEIVVLHGNPSTHLRELGKWNSAEVDGLGVVVVLESVTEVSGAQTSSQTSLPSPHQLDYSNSSSFL